MNIEDEVTRLLNLAAPLRLLADTDPAKEVLTGIVDEVNRLRAVEALTPRIEPVATIEGADPEPVIEPVITPVAESVRRLGRPKKAYRT